MSLLGHFRELGCEAVRRGTDKFTFDPLMYCELSRGGFTVRDELESFCWLSDSLFWPNKDKMTVTVKVPSAFYLEYWMDRLSSTVGAMERY